MPTHGSIEEKERNLQNAVNRVVKLVAPNGARCATEKSNQRYTGPYHVVQKTAVSCLRLILLFHFFVCITYHNPEHSRLCAEKL